MQGVTTPKKPGKPRGRPPSEAGPTVSVSTRISQAKAKILEKYVESILPRTSTAAVLELALDRYLQSLGLLPGDEPDD